MPQAYFYLSILPEALIASMLPPEEFGCYYAVGTKKRTRGQAMFFEVDPALRSDHFPLHTIASRCVPHPDGTPKHSVYLSVYRVLENVPVEALRGLYLVTDDGRVLELKPAPYEPGEQRGVHLYQELLPVTPRIASTLNPLEFSQRITDGTQAVWLPKIVFVELVLNGLAEDPVNGDARNLPYQNLYHLRDCLDGLKDNPEKQMKTVIRYVRDDLLYRTIRNGFFVGAPDKLLYYPFPSKEQLENEHFPWWRSAQTVGFSW